MRISISLSILVMYAFKVIRVVDEYIIMSFLHEVEEFKGQMLIKGVYDMLIFVDKRDHKEHNIYFDVTVHMSQMENSFNQFQ